MQEIKKNVPKRYKRELFETEVDGCMFSLQDYDGRPLRKTWWILHTDADFHKQFTASAPTWKSASGPRPPRRSWSPPPTLASLSG